MESHPFAFVPLRWLSSVLISLLIEYKPLYDFIIYQKTFKGFSYMWKNDSNLKKKKNCFQISLQKINDWLHITQTWRGKKIYLIHYLKVWNKSGKSIFKKNIIFDLRLKCVVINIYFLGSPSKLMACDLNKAEKIIFWSISWSFQKEN